MAGLKERADNLLDPVTGIMRGLTKGDRGDKPLGITIGEAREVQFVVAALAARAFRAQPNGDPVDGGGRVDPRIATAYVDGIGSQMLELQEDCIALRLVLATAAKQFRSYEEQHRAKRTPDADAKAQTNATFAQRMEDAIGTNPHVEVDQLLRRVIDVTWAIASTGQPSRVQQDAILRRAMAK